MFIRNKCLIINVLPWSSWPAEYPWAWWSLSWHEWRTNLYLRTSLPCMPRQPPAARRWPKIGTANQICTLGRSHAPAVGMAACGWGAQWISGTCGSHGVQLCQVGIDEVSSLLCQSHSPFCEQPCSPVASAVPSTRYSCGRSTLYVPFTILSFFILFTPFLFQYWLCGWMFNFWVYRNILNIFD